MEGNLCTRFPAGEATPTHHRLVYPRKKNKKIAMPGDPSKGSGELSLRMYAKIGGSQVHPNHMGTPMGDRNPA